MKNLLLSQEEQAQAEYEDIEKVKIPKLRRTFHGFALGHFSLCIIGSITAGVLGWKFGFGLGWAIIWATCIFCVYNIYGCQKDLNHLIGLNLELQELLMRRIKLLQYHLSIVNRYE